MKNSELKKITDALARFATTREKADGPIALVGVQKKGDTLKFISGHSKAGMVVAIPEFTGENGDFSYTVLARPLLQTSKVLPAKSLVHIDARRDGLHLQTEGGGSFDISPTGLSMRDAGFARKPRGARIRGTLDKATLKRMAKLFKAISAKVMVPSVQIADGVGYAVALSPGDSHAMYANYRFPAENINGDDDNYAMAGYREFWEALTHFTEDATIEWDRTGVRVIAGNMECFSAPYLVSRWNPETKTSEAPEEVLGWPIMLATEKSGTATTIPRKDLLTVVKAQAPFDEHNRVTLTVDTDSIRVSPYGSDDGMDMPAISNGKGIRSVNADYLTALLNAMDSKEVTLRWSRGTPAISISSEGYSSWTILLAPVAL